MSRDIIDEVSGVFEAELLEDMADTVRRTRRPYIDCKIPAVLDEDQHPLTYVPAIYMTYPLKKGDKVLVRFNQDNFRYPVLWKITTEFENQMVEEKVQFPSAGQVIFFPSSEKVVAVKRINKDYYVYVTDKYTLVRTGDQFTLISPDGETTNVTNFKVLADSIILETKKEYKLVAAQAITLKSSGAELLEIGNSIATLGSLFNELFSRIDDLCTKLGTLRTEGPPTNHTASAWYASDISPLQLQIAALKEKVLQVFKQ